MTNGPKRIGFTTSLPVEVLFAAGHIPVDLNNLFISNQPSDLILQAEHAGFPRTVCSWIKGIYTAAVKSGLDEVIGVTQGDCSNTHSLMAMLTDQGMVVHDFAFPYPRDYQQLEQEISKLEAIYDVTSGQVRVTKQRLDQIRNLLQAVDELTWKDGLVTGAENHQWLLSSSDFNGNPDLYEAQLQSFLSAAKHRSPFQPKLRLAYLGVPPIFSDLYEVIHQLGGEVVYNEVQHQFAMLGRQQDIVQQYLDYTYPYTVFDRLRTIRSNLARRQVEAVISYTQAFCHRQIDNILLRKYIDLPFLTLEGDAPGCVDSRTLLRLESFLQIHAH